MSGWAKIFLPMLDRLNGTKIFSDLEFLNQSQWWSTCRLKELQEEKLKRIIKAAYAGVPYYRNLFKQSGLTDKDIQSIDDLKKLPILNKATLRNNWQRFINQNYSGRDAIKSFTSGSTGMPMQFLLSREQESWRWAARYRFWQWAGYELGQPYAVMSTNPRNSSIKKFQDKVTNCTYFHLNSADPDYFYNFLTKLSQKKITFLVGYANSVYLLAKFAQQEHIKEIQLKGIVTHGETLLPHFTKIIEKQFGCKVSDLYGAGGEGFHVAAQCEFGNGYHIDMENVIVETSEICNGISEILLTGLDNIVMPLIRYNINDVGKLSLSKCLCGRGLIVLDQIYGRTGDFVLTPNNQVLGFLFFTGLFIKKKGIDQFQVNQKKIDTILIKYVPNKNFIPNELEAIAEEIIHATKNQMKVEFEKVAAIPLASSGKLRLSISEVWSSFNADQRTTA